MYIAIGIALFLLVAKIIATLLKMVTMIYSMLELERDKLKLSEEIKDYLLNNIKLTEQQSEDLIKITTNFQPTINEFSLKRIYDESEASFEECMKIYRETNKEG